jgi:Swt1-like HEPN
MQVDLQVKILELLYGEWFKSNIAGLSVQALTSNTVSSENEIYTALGILEAGWLIQKNDLSWYVITIGGVDRYEEMLPPSQITRKREERRRILDVLLPFYQDDVHNWITNDELAKQTQMIDLLYLLATVEYMHQSGLVDLDVLNGGAFYVRISAGGVISLQNNITDNMIAMANAYKILFNLENHLRQYIELRMRNNLGPECWNNGVSDNVRQKAAERKLKESNMGWKVSVTKGDSEYLLFEDLSKIMVVNWERVFKQDLHDQEKIKFRLKELEDIRNAIAHTRTLTQEGMTRLEHYSQDLLTLTK